MTTLNSSPATQAIEVALSEAPSVKIRLILDVEYQPNGETPEGLVENLKGLVEYGIGNGMLTGTTAAEVDQYSMDAKVVDDLLTEDELTHFMQQRIQNGDLDIGDVSNRLARYGLMEPHDFSAEMAERITLSQTE